MTPFQSEIERIIRTFSHWERVRFAQQGGSLPHTPAPDNEWYQPPKPGIPFVRKQPAPGKAKRVDESKLIRVRLDGAGSYTVREAAYLLNVRLTHLRQKVREEVCVVRGVKVSRLTPRRRRYGDVKEGKAA